MEQTTLDTLTVPRAYWEEQRRNLLQQVAALNKLLSLDTCCQECGRTARYLSDKDRTQK